MVWDKMSNFASQKTGLYICPIKKAQIGTLGIINKQKNNGKEKRLTGKSGTD